MAAGKTCNSPWTHVCLVSNQPLPNLVPLLMEKPQKAILLVSPEMRAEAERLARVVQPRGITLEQREIPSAYDFAAVHRICENVIATCPDNADLTLNVTGGTKIAALAAFQVFYFSNRRIVYLDSFNNQLLQLSPANTSTPIIGNIVKVRDCLVAYGMNPLRNNGAVQDTDYPPCLSELTELLTRNHTLLSGLNSAIDRCGKNPSFIDIQVNDLGEGAGKLASLLEGCGMAGRNAATLHIASREKIFFCHGGWLEEYVYRTVKTLGLKGLDAAMNVRVEWDGKGRRPTQNEFDVLFTYANRLHIISCKSSNPDKKTSSGNRATEALNELDALADRAGGLFGRAMLVSAHPLSPYDRERAKKMKIRLVQAEAVSNLRTDLLHWIVER